MQQPAWLSGKAWAAAWSLVALVPAVFAALPQALVAEGGERAWQEWLSGQCQGEPPWLNGSKLSSFQRLLLVQVGMVNATQLLACQCCACACITFCVNVCERARVYGCMCAEFYSVCVCEP